MTINKLELALLVVLLVLVAGQVFISRQMQSLADNVGHQEETILELKGELKIMPDYSTSWTSSRGLETVNTTCGSEESVEDCETRHDETVARRQKAWPPLKP